MQLPHIWDTIDARGVAMVGAHAALSLGASVSALWFLVSWRDATLPLVPMLTTGILGLLLLASFVGMLGRFRDDKPMLFVTAAIPATCAFALLIVPDQVPDEIWHIFRTLDVFGDHAHMIVPDSLRFQEMPTTYAELGPALAQQGWGDTYVAERDDMSRYLTHLYLIPGMAAGVARALGANPFVAIYVARLANAALFVAVGWWVVATVPIAQTCVLVYLLNPMLIQQQASCSADAMSNLSSFVFMALLLADLFAEDLGRRDVILLVVAGVVMALSKFAYAPLLLLLFLLLPRVGSVRTRRIVVCATVALVALGAVYMLLFYRGTLRPGVELACNPPECALVLANTLREVGAFWITSFAGECLGALNANPWLPLVWTYVVIMVLSVFHNDDADGQRQLTSRQKAFIMVVLLLTAVLIVLALRDWSVNVLGIGDYISGVQGRYFLPLVIYALICLRPRDTPSVTTRPQLAYVAIMAAVYVGDVLTFAALYH